MSGDTFTFRALDAYCLTLNETKMGQFTVYRSDFEDWGGQLVAVNRRLATGFFRSRERAGEAAASYAERNPGCMTDGKARALLAAGVSGAD